MEGASVAGGARRSLDQHGRKSRVGILRDRFVSPPLKRRTRDIGNRKRKATTLGKIIVCSWNYRGEVSTYAWLALWVPG
jgi:hypothetical protein